MNACEHAAAQSAWDRHVRQALEQSRPLPPAQAPAPAAPPVLVAVKGGRPGRAPRGSRHPALRGDAR